MTHNNPIPVAVALLECCDPATGEVGLLALERGIQPRLGGLAFPGGYVDERESAEMAAVRECFEEVGLALAAEKFVPLCTRITPDNKLLIFLTYGQVLPWPERFEATAEARSIQMASPDTALAFPLHQDVKDLWFARKTGSNV